MELGSTANKALNNAKKLSRTIRGKLENPDYIPANKKKGAINACDRIDKHIEEREQRRAGFGKVIEKYRKTGKLEVEKIRKKHKKEWKEKKIRISRTYATLNGEEKPRWYKKVGAWSRNRRERFIEVMKTKKKYGLAPHLITRHTGTKLRKLKANRRP